MNQIIVVDAKNLLYKAHFTHRTLATSSGVPTSVLFGMLSSILSLSKRLPGAQWTFVWDGRGRTWRHELLDEVIVPEKTVIETKTKPTWIANQLESSISFLQGAGKPSRTNPDIGSTGGSYRSPAAPRTVKILRPSGYKAHRDAVHNSGDHQVALSQVAELKQVLKQLGFRQFEVPNLEGDDLVGILVYQLKNYFDEVIIYSSDRDFFQFIEPKVKQLKGLKEGKLVWAFQQEIEHEFGIDLCDWVKLKALMGDSSDNIPKLFDKVGPVTAAGWIKQGLDPSLESFSSHMISVQELFTKLVVRKNLVPLAERWPAVHRNYRLCKIITNPKAKELKLCHVELEKQLRGLDQNSFHRRPAKDLFRWFSEWLVRLEMTDLYGRRSEFQDIP